MAFFSKGGLYPNGLFAQDYVHKQSHTEKPDFYENSGYRDATKPGVYNDEAIDYTVSQTGVTSFTV